MKQSTCKQCGKYFRQKNDGRRRFCSGCASERNTTSSIKSYYRKKEENPDKLRLQHRIWKRLQRQVKDCSPTPYTFEMENNTPVIKDANKHIVCTLSTGTIDGAYSIATILANANRLLKGNQK